MSSSHKVYLHLESWAEQQFHHQLMLFHEYAHFVLALVLALYWNQGTYAVVPGRVSNLVCSIT